MPARKDNPFIGLRPFESDESILFFGRQEQTTELLHRLHKHHFVAIVGSSGSGKSSLIRAGLIPKLQAGYLVNDRDKWIIAATKPGQSPLFNLAFSILQQTADRGNHTKARELVKNIREQGVDAIFEVLEPVWDKNNTNLFLLIDQFEELFVWYNDLKDLEKKDEAVEYVNIMLDMAGQAELPIYTVMTMRSDYISDCTKFYGLPEALNQSQYLVPRLNRTQLKTAIEGPVKIYGGALDPGLTMRMLNDIRLVGDELPLIQHAMMRIWDYEMKIDRNHLLDIEDYEKVGGLEKALSNHADEALEGMSDHELNITRKIFQSITKTDMNGRRVRRPTRLSVLEKLTGASKKQLMDIIQRFIVDNRLFLVVYDTESEADKVVDISHEALIRQWSTLNKWVEDEADSARQLIRLIESEQLHRRNKAGFLGGVELDQTWRWYSEFNPSDEWAGGYSPLFKQAFEYLEQSKRASDAELQKMKRQKRTRYIITGSLMGLLFITMASFAFFQNRNAERISLYSQRLAKVNIDLDSTNMLYVKLNIQLNRKNDSLAAAIQKADESYAAAVQSTKMATENAKRADRLARQARHEKNVAEEQKKRAEKLVESFGLTLLASDKANEDPTIALGIMQEAKKIENDSNAIVSRAANRLYRSNLFYKTFLPPFKNDTIEYFTIPALDGERFFRIGRIEDEDVYNMELLRKDRSVIQSKTIPDPNDRAGAASLTSNGALSFLIEDTLYIVQTSNLDMKRILLKSDSTRDIDYIAVSPDKQMIVTCSFDSSMTIWNERGIEVSTVPIAGHPSVVTFSPDGETFGVGVDNKTWIYNKKGERKSVLEGHKTDVTFISFSPSGRFTAVGAEDGRVIVYNDYGGIRVTIAAHNEEISSIAFSPDESLLATASEDAEATVWDLDGNRLDRLVSSDAKGILVMQFTGDGTAIDFGLESGEARRWYLKGGYVTKRLYLPMLNTRPDWISLAFAENADHTAFLASFKENSDAAPFFNLMGTDFAGFHGLSYVQPRDVARFALSPNAESLSIVNKKNEIFLFQRNGDSNSLIKLDTATLIAPGGPVPIEHITFAGNGSALAYTHSRTLTTLNIGEGNGFSDVYNTDITSISSPYGSNLLYVGLDNGIINAYDLSGRRVKNFIGHDTAILSVNAQSDGQIVAGGFKDGTVTLWRNDQSILKHFTAHTDSVSHICFSPFKNMLATASPVDKSFRIWDLKGNLLKEVKGSKPVIAIKFSPDGQELFVAWDDGTVHVFSPITMTLDEFLNAKLFDELTEDKKKEFRRLAVEGY